MASCLNPVSRSARGQPIWAVYRERAEKLNTGAVNPLLTRYIELVSLQARLSSILIETLDVTHSDSDHALLGYFDGEALASAPCARRARCEREGADGAAR